jgi:hypothetical protein
MGRIVAEGQAQVKSAQDPSQPIKLGVAVLICHLSCWEKRSKEDHDPDWAGINLKIYSNT